MQMKLRLACLSTTCAFLTSAADAHKSIVPHDHPHETSLLPSAEMFLLVALALGVGIIAGRALRKSGQK